MPHLAVVPRYADPCICWQLGSRNSTNLVEVVARDGFVIGLPEELNGESFSLALSNGRVEPAQ